MDARQEDKFKKYKEYKFENMKRFFVGLICLTGIVNAQTVQDINSVSAYSNEINAGSARYMGMGGSMGALGGDISSVEQNPAGLAVAITSDINVGLGVATYKNESKFGNTFKTDDSDVDFSNIGSNFVFNTNSGAWNRFSIGIKYSQESLDNYIHLGKNDNVQETLLTNEDLNEYTTYKMAGYHDEVVGRKTKMSINFGASYKDQIYLGAGMNFHDVQYDNYIAFDEDTDGTVYRYELNGTPYRSSATGVSLNAGIIGKVNEQFRLGLAYHSPVWYRNIQEEFFANLQVNDTDYEYDLYYSEFDRNSNSRLVASAGVVIGKSLALNADYTLHMNGSMKLKPSQYYTATNTFYDDYLKSSSEFRFGGEFRVDKFRLRAGYNYVQSPYDNDNLVLTYQNGTDGVTNSGNISKAFQGDTNRFSIGAGYDFGGFYLDVAYQYQTQKYSYIFGNGDYVDYDTYDNTVYYATLPLNTYNYVADVENRRGLFLLTAGWQF